MSNAYEKAQKKEFNRQRRETISRTRNQANLFAEYDRDGKRASPLQEILTTELTIVDLLGILARQETRL